MSVIVFNPETFKALYPELTKTKTGNDAYNNAQLTTYWDLATTYINDNNSPCGLLSAKQRGAALNMMTAHLLDLSKQIAKGKTPGLKTASSIDKISITITPPPVKTQWQWWLSLTPYGQQLYALLQIAAAGGIYVGGRPELAAFRRPGGFY